MNGEGGQQMAASTATRSLEERGARRAWAIICSTYRWLLCAAYFFPVCSFLVLLGIFVDPRKNDGAQRMLCRVTMKLAGVKLVVRRAPGFDPKRNVFFLVNHVNLFDPFVLYATIPQFFRGLELESHFRIPVYGWMMKRFGNVPVPDQNRPSDLKRMWRLSRAAIDSGVSLAVFPEGQRTLDGRVGRAGVLSRAAGAVRGGRGAGLGVPRRRGGGSYVGPVRVLQEGRGADRGGVPAGDVEGPRGRGGLTPRSPLLPGPSRIGSVVVQSGQVGVHRA